MLNMVLVPIRRTSIFCGARRRQGDAGATCRKPSGWGTNHMGTGTCRLHGGSTAAHGRHAQWTLARRVAELFAVPRADIDPVNGLIEELQRSAGLIEYYEAECAQLFADEVVWGETSVEETRPAVDPNAEDDGADLAPVERKVRSASGVNTWIKVLNEERDRFTHLCVAMIKLDLDHRRLTFQQSQVGALVQLMLSPDLGLSEEQKRVAARLLRELDTHQTAVVDGVVVS